jgi:antirestriction protein ArdC
MKTFTLEERAEWERQRDQQNDVLLRQLAEGVANLGSEPAFREYLKVQRLFHDYSPSNCLLLASQAAERDMDLSRVAGYSSWVAMHRQVRKGEVGLVVFAPMRVISKDTKEENRVEEDEHRLLFKAVRVFNETQTEGRPLPEPVKLLDGDDLNGSFARLQQVAANEGLRVFREDLGGDVRGYYRSAERKIVVSNELSGAQSVKVLAHELGHFFLGHKSYAEGSREDYELEAEAVAFVVAGNDLIGIDTSDYALGYIATWQGGTKEAVQKIKECTGRIQQASKTITERLERVMAETDAAQFQADLDVARRSFQQRQEAFRPRGEGRKR